MGPTGQGRHDTQNRTVPETVDPGIGKEPEPVDSLCRHTEQYFAFQKLDPTLDTPRDALDMATAERPFLA